MPKYKYKKFKGGARRLRNWDYKSNGAYYVTICTKNRKDYFGNIVNGEMQLNKFGKIVNNQWIWLRENVYVYLDEYVIMPNHFHGILFIDNSKQTVDAGHDLRLPSNMHIKNNRGKIKSLSKLIGAFKMTSSKLIRLSGSNNFRWQPRFYDHIIHDENNLNRIRKYIQNNPTKWWTDRSNC